VRILAPALVLALAAACGRGGEAVKDMEAFADRMCACPDRACALEEMKQFSEMVTRHKDTTVNESQQKAFDAAGKRFAECMQKLP
jgi:hypothetical protein